MGQGIRGLLLLAGWCALGFGAAWRIRGEHPEVAACLAAALAAGIGEPAVHGVHDADGGDFLRDDRAGGGDGGAQGRARGARWVPAGVLPLLYFAARIAIADHALALAQRMWPRVM